MKQRLDKFLVDNNFFDTRSQAENSIRLGDILVNQKVAQKPGLIVSEKDNIKITRQQQYVSRAGLKLASVAKIMQLNFAGKTVLDIGSSTGGFTDYALKNGAQKVIAVDVGTNQLHPKLRLDSRIELHEKTDIRDFLTGQKIDLIVGDVSFISLTKILPHVAQNLMNRQTILVAMVKPQFEAQPGQTVKGVVKNNKIRRDILKKFEDWAVQYFYIIQKRDSSIAGANGNVERFYKLKLKNQPKR